MDERLNWSDENLKTKKIVLYFYPRLSQIVLSAAFLLTTQTRPHPTEAAALGSVNFTWNSSQSPSPSWLVVFLLLSINQIQTIVFFFFSQAAFRLTIGAHCADSSPSFQLTNTLLDPSKAQIWGIVSVSTHKTNQKKGRIGRGARTVCVGGISWWLSHPFPDSTRFLRSKRAQSIRKTRFVIGSWFVSYEKIFWAVVATMDYRLPL